MVFFEEQTGIFKDHDWDSNFYHYELRNSHPPTNQSTEDWLNENIANATVESDGLVFSPEFRNALEIHEEFTKVSQAKLKRLQNS